MQKLRSKVMTKCRITVLKKTLFKDLQETYLADPKSGVCPFFEEGQVFEVTSDDFFSDVTR